MGIQENRNQRAMLRMMRIIFEIMEKEHRHREQAHAAMDSLTVVGRNHHRLVNSQHSLESRVFVQAVDILLFTSREVMSAASCEVELLLGFFSFASYLPSPLPWQFLPFAFW